MVDIKFSRALAELLGKLSIDGGIISAEKMLLALISDNSSDNPEYVGAKSLICNACTDMDALRNGLETMGTPNFLDDLYMKKKIAEAKERATAVGQGELTVDVLAAVIINDPPKSVKPVIDATRIAAPVTAKESSSEEGSSDSADVGLDRAVIDELRRKFEERLRGIAATEPSEQTAESNGSEPEPEPEPISEEDRINGQKTKVQELDARVKAMGRNIKNVIFGQDNAINVFLRGYFQSEMNSYTEKERRRPKATFLFAGPPGVGKTFLAETVAKELGIPFKRFDMSEYSSREATTDLCGSNGVYKGAEEGQLTSFVKSNPECLLLFDEIEKAHISAIHLFLQVLDAGILRDANSNKSISFKDAIIIFTSNAGKQLYEESESDDFSLVTKKAIVNALRKDVDPTTGVPYFPAAICSRFATGNVVMFNRMTAHNLRSICKSEILRNAKRFTDTFGVDVEIDEKVYAALLFSEGANVDARTIRARAEAFFNGEIYELTRLLGSDKVNATVAGLEKITVSVDMARTEESIKKLFLAGADTRCLVFADSKKGAAIKAAVPYMNMICVDNSSDAFLALKESSIDFIIIDVSCGMEIKDGQALNVDDVDSDARIFFKALVARGSTVPVYMMEYGDIKITDEEKASFAAQGVRSFIRYESAESFSQVIDGIADTINQQAAMISLARESKIARFETAQFVSADGKTADIKIFDVDPMTVVEADDGDTLLSASKVPDITFDMVIGADGAKKEMEFFVNALKNPRKFAESGLRPPKGILMYGPPGTGKTMLAKAMAHEAGVAFVATEGNRYLTKYVGEGADKLHEVFRTARKYAPAILFIDEIDAIGRERKGGNGSSGGDTHADVLTALLTEMDGFVSDPKRPVFVLAATNFDVTPGTPKSLDEALMRRFDRLIYVDLPDKNARLRFLQMKTKGRTFLVTEEGLTSIASRAVGMSLAKLDSVLELAMRNAMMSGSLKVTDAILEEAFETYNSGDKKQWNISYIERVARHEAGHAFMCWYSGETPSYLTIVARGSHGGYMQHADNEDKPLYTREELLANIRTSLGGRASEIVFYGEEDGVSTGASGDLASATAMAQRLICDYGMNDEFGLAVVSHEARHYGEISTRVREIVNGILREQMKRTVEILTENREKINALVEALMVKNSMNATEIEAVLGKTPRA